MWAKAAHKLAAVIRKCGDRAVWKEVGEGGVRLHMKSTPPPVQRTGPFRPTQALQMRKAVFPPRHEMWAKAAHRLGAVIRKCGDRAVSNEAGEGECVCI
jgi:hypothetical protein